MKKVLFRRGISGGRFEVIEPGVSYDPSRHGGHFQVWVQDMVQAGAPEGQYLVVVEDAEYRTTRAYLYEATVLSAVPPPVEVTLI